MTEEERKSVLELSSYQNILLKVKSEQLVGGAVHLVVKASKIDHKRGLEEIKDQSITAKTSYRPVWL